MRKGAISLEPSLSILKGKGGDIGTRLSIHVDGLLQHLFYLHVYCEARPSSGFDRLVPGDPITSSPTVSPFNDTTVKPVLSGHSKIDKTQV